MDFKQDVSSPSGMSTEELDRALGLSALDSQGMDATIMLDKLMSLGVDGGAAGVGPANPFMSAAAVPVMTGNEYLSSTMAMTSMATSNPTQAKAEPHLAHLMSHVGYNQPIASANMAATAAVLGTSPLQTSLVGGVHGNVPPGFGTVSVALTGPSNPSLGAADLATCGLPTSTVLGAVPPAAASAVAGGTSPNMSTRSPLPAGGAYAQYEEEERQKREMHNFIERRRRYNINDRIKELGSLLPGTEPDTRQNKGNILKTAVNYIKRLQKVEARYRELSRKHRQYSKTLSVFKSRLEEYDAACQSNGILVPSASQEAALLTRVDLARVTLDQCVTLVDCLESAGSEVSDISSIGSSVGASEDDLSDDDDVRSTSSTHSVGSASRRHAPLTPKQ
ncbi:transcription factor EB-like [Sycon ciliatum]|uniref:transcription factor EB-like n=1 Tax=Sycon ciliatum TaxID=27933 RepID=UPI0031F6A3C9